MPRQAKTNNPTLDIGGCAGGVQGLGPGKRAVLWVRGCPLACPGCMTPELWESGTPASFITIEQAAALLRPLLAGADGLTISGGEPMEQPAALLHLVKSLRQEFTDLEVLVYSGYHLEELRARTDETQDFLQEIDILIDNPFDQTATNELKWRGSDNQRIHYLSQRARHHESQSETWSEPRPLQIQTLAPGQFRLIGIPRRGDMAQYRKLMENRGLDVRKVKANNTTGDK